MQTSLEEKKSELFIEKYVKYANLKTDAPAQYHHSIALSLLSSITCRNYTAEFQHGTIFPNLWIILLGQSSLDRKSTAMNIGKKLLPSSVRRIPEEFSPEALIASLSLNPHGIMFRDEFAGFMSILRKEYMLGTKDFFCILYDSPDFYTRTLKSTTYHLKNIYFNILSGTTFTSLTENLTDEDLKSGYGARYLFCIGEKTLWKGIELRKKDDITMTSELKKTLMMFHSFFLINKVTAIFPEDVLDRYNTWLYELENKRGEKDNIDLTPFYTRIGISVSKIAMLIQLQKEEDKMKECLDTNTKISEIFVDKGSLELAIIYGEQYLKDICKIASCIMPAERQMRAVKKIKEIIERKKKIDHSLLMRNTNVNANEFKDAIKTLEEREEIEMIIEGKRKMYILKEIKR